MQKPEVSSLKYFGNVIVKNGTKEQLKKSYALLVV